MNEGRQNRSFLMPLDEMSPKFIFNRKFNIYIPNRMNWSNNSTNGDVIWYTDGSKTDEGTGAGIVSSGAQLSISLGEYATIFQAEVYAINHCAHLILANNHKGKRIIIMSDSQAAIRALNSMTITSRIVCKTINVLQKISEHNTIVLHWKAAHCDHEGNEIATKLAKVGIKKKLSDLNQL